MQASKAISLQQLQDLLAFFMHFFILNFKGKNQFKSKHSWKLKEVVKFPNSSSSDKHASFVYLFVCLFCICLFVCLFSFLCFVFILVSVFKSWFKFKIPSRNPIFLSFSVIQCTCMHNSQKYAASR